jgi:hypothetical protein
MDGIYKFEAGQSIRLNRIPGCQDGSICRFEQLFYRAHACCSVRILRISRVRLDN